MTDLTPEPIFQLATGFMAAKHMFIANEIGLFAVLADGPAPLDRLAALTGIARPRVRILADALVTLGLLEEEARSWLQESGWRAVERKPLTGALSLLVAETAA